MMNFKGRYGSITDTTVHGVQMDSTVRWNNTGWYSISTLTWDKLKIKMTHFHQRPI